MSGSYINFCFKRHVRTDGPAKSYFRGNTVYIKSKKTGLQGCMLKEK